MEFVDRNGNTVTCTVDEYLTLTGIKTVNAPPMEFGGDSLGRKKTVRRYRRKNGKDYEIYAQKAYYIIRDSESPITLNKLMDGVGLTATNMSQRKYFRKALIRKIRGTDIICVKKHRRVSFGRKQVFAGKRNLPSKPAEKYESKTPPLRQTLKKPKKNAYLSFRSQRIKELMKAPYNLDYMNASKRASEEYSLKHPKANSGNYNHKIKSFDYEHKIKQPKEKRFMGKTFAEHMMRGEAEASVELDGGTFTGTEGQDRKSYSDTQDRESYIPEPFPEFKTLNEGANKIIEGIIKNMIANHNQITMPNEGMLLGLTEGIEWGAFCQEFEALSDRISTYFGVSDKFVKKKLLGKYDYVEYES